MSTRWTFGGAGRCPHSLQDRPSYAGNLLKVQSVLFGSRNALRLARVSRGRTNGTDEKVNRQKKQATLRNAKGNAVQVGGRWSRDCRWKRADREHRQWGCSVSGGWRGSAGCVRRAFH